MTTDDREVLSALLDGEAIDPGVLARVLEASDNRRLLVDFARLRALVGGIADRGSRISDREARIADRGSRVGDRGSGIADHGAGIADRGSQVADREARIGRARRAWLAAAAVALLGIGLAGGSWFARRAVDVETAPEPSRIVQLAPVPSARGDQP